MTLNSSPLFFHSQYEALSFKNFIALAVLAHIAFFFGYSKVFSNFSFSTPSSIVYENKQTINLNLTSLKPDSLNKVQKKESVKKVTKNSLITDKVKKETEEIKEESSSNSKSATRAQPFSKNKIYAAYPPLAEEMEIEGTVFMKFLVSSSGQIVDVKVLKSSGSKLLDDAAVRALKTAKSFTPALDKSGHPISSWGEYSINFSLTEDS